MILNYLAKSKRVLECINDNVKRISKSNQNFNMYTIASDYQKNNRMIFVVLPTLFDAQTYYDGLLNLVCEDDVLFYPVDEMVAASLLIASNEFKFERISTIISMLEDKPRIVVTNVNGVLRGILPFKKWRENIIKLEVGKNYDLHEIKRKLVEFGYKNVSVVSKSGEFSVRGSIIDYFPINSLDPVRLDFFDDELDTIKTFDVNTQLSKLRIKEAKIFPIVELFYDDEVKNKIVDNLNGSKATASELEYNLLCKDILRIDERNELDVVYNYANLFSELESIIDYPNDNKIYLVNEDKIEGITLEIEKETNQYYDDLASVVLRQFSCFLDKDKVLKNKNILKVDTLVDHQESFMIDVEEVPSFYGNFDEIIKACTKRLNTHDVILVFNNPERLKRLKDAFLENMIKYKTIQNLDEVDNSCINLLLGSFALTLSIPKEGIYILTESTMFINGIERRKIRYKSTFSEGTKIANFNDLNPGDYIVHMNYGIGLYEGVETKELSGRKRDYLSILYADNDRLYIPVEQLKSIKKYCGSDAKAPSLTKIGSNSWNKTKQKVKEKVRELGEKLIKLYAEREASTGFACEPDTLEQMEFEQEFDYELTPDQLAAIKACKLDMESHRPMDRLVCGDVGFGKTEVALRAAFKAVMNGKQVCYLAPTTVLTRQHYHTFKLRMEKYGVRVELLNRFVSAKAAKQIIKDLAFGTIDVLIGTHRLLSDDIKFKDLGLLITDEEQRFGVIHKEKIKQMKINVDALTLTATPIPRTLQMSLIGIKELSMIETPPKNRYPIQTYVTMRHDTIIKEAIERELLRGGQIFYLYNYTEDIEQKAVEINRLVPEAKVCYAHGKMDKYALEKIISAFIDHEYDVLVSTTIIETGIDIPEANTLIINDADLLGLSQLYQIRGRVGRSDRIAYAYLMYEPRKVLTPEAEERLKAIKEFTELGSGFKIAMRDLAIRGAGDILGQEQSGFIDSVGLDLYMQILDDTLKEMRGEKKETPKAKPNKSVLANRYIPTSFELPQSLKIEIHQKVSMINSLKDLELLEKELIDRFGIKDEDLKLYMYEKLFNSLCVQNDIESVEIKPKLITLVMSYDRSQNINGEFIYRSAFELSNNFLLSYHNQKITINFKTGNYPNNTWLPLMCQYLNKIL